MGSLKTKTETKLPCNLKAGGVSKKGEWGRESWKANRRLHVIETVTTLRVYSQFLDRPHGIMLEGTGQCSFHCL